MACDTAELLGVAFGSRLQVVSCGAGKGGRKAQGRLVPLDERVLATDAEELETRAPPAPAPALARSPHCARPDAGFVAQPPAPTTASWWMTTPRRCSSTRRLSR